jgi:selenophosphate synthetase-related protein
MMLGALGVFQRLVDAALLLWRIGPRAVLVFVHDAWSWGGLYVVLIVLVCWRMAFYGSLL